MKEIQSHLCLGDQTIPQVLREIIGDAGKDGQKIGLEVFNGSLSRILAVYLRGYQLKLAPPLLSDEALVLLTRLIVQYLEVDIEIISLDTTHKCVICIKAVLVLSCLV